MVSFNYRDPTDWFFGVSILGILFLIINSIAISIDKENVNYTSSSVIVSSTEYVPAHNTIVYTQSGKVMVPNIIHHSSEWIVSVNFEGEKINCKTNERNYNNVKSGDTVVATIGRSVVFDNIYCSGISL